jgi:hypothetical protein
MKALLYLLQVSACTGIFYLFYYVFLRRLTFFTINRWYLLASLLISFIIPAITIPVSTTEPSAIMQPVIYIQHAQIVNEPAKVLANNEAVAGSQIDWMLTLRYIYMVMALISITHLLISIALFFWRAKSEKLLQIGHVKVLKADKLLGNSSFLNVIFINDAGLDPAEIKQIIAHELLHVSLFHSADRLIARLVQVILWFNPFAYLYIRAIEENHEFEVDHIAANNDDKGMYATLLFKLASSGQDYLFHGFSKVPIKKRIVMLFNQPTKNMKKAVYLFMLPLVAISCLAFANLKKDDKVIATAKAKKQNKAKLRQTDSALMRMQKYYTDARLARMTEVQKAEVAYQYTDDAKEKRALASAVMNAKTLTLKITAVDNDKKGLPVGLVGEYNGNKYEIASNYGRAKHLNMLIKIGDEVTITPFHSDFMFRKDKPVTIEPAIVVKNGAKIYQLAEADKIPVYPFLSEENKVKYAEGQVSFIVKYPNGKWKTALFETVNGYKFDLSFKPDAPDLNNITEGDHVRLRFMHEVKRRAKEYKVSEWVSITTYQQEYKNPDLFINYYTEASSASAPNSAVWKDPVFSKESNAIPPLGFGNEMRLMIKPLNGKAIFPNFKSEAPLAVLTEYNSILKNYHIDTPANHPILERSPFSIEDQKTLENLYGQMSEKQQIQLLVSFGVIYAPFQKVYVPVRYFNWFKNQSQYSIWIDNKRVSNRDLAKFEASDFAFYHITGLNPTAAKIENAKYEVNLMTPAFFTNYSRQRVARKMYYTMPVSAYQGKI